MEINDVARRQSWPRRWYSFNKQKIPAIFTTVGTLFFTAFLDFNVQGTEIKLESHIAALKQLTGSTLSNLAAPFMFCIYLISIIQFFNSFTFAKKRSPFGLIMLTILTLLQVFLVIKYTQVYFVEDALREDYVIDAAAKLSYTVFIIGAVMFIIGTFFAWLYVNWKYVKVKED
ncbi:MAG: hypothetical protein JXB20_00775 [Bacilli bacterium]|nr:hypothetical protein [Bacilli bacterium]